MAITDTILARGGILVAHDGSAQSDAALRTALRCAPAFGGWVHVVRAWSIATAATPSGSTLGHVPGIDEFEAATLAALEGQVAPLRALHHHVEVVTSVVHGPAAEKIIEASDQVDLIVIGSRGRGGFAALLLGSTSGQVVQHAKCGVLVDRGSGVDHREAMPTAAEVDSDDQMMQRALASELGLD